MREVLPELMRWWRAGETVGVGTVVATFRSAPRPGGRVDAGRAGRRGRRLGLRRLRRGRGLRARPGGRRLRRARCCSATASATTTRSRSGSPAAASSTSSSRRCRPRDLPRARRGRRRHRGRPAGRGRHRHRPPRPRLGRAAPRRAARGRRAGRRCSARSAAPRADAAVTDDARGLLAAGRTETLTYGPDGERRGEGMRVFVAAYAPRPGCSCSAPSTSRRRWPGSAASSATG